MLQRRWHCERKSRTQWNPPGSTARERWRRLSRKFVVGRGIEHGAVELRTGNV